MIKQLSLTLFLIFSSLVITATNSFSMSIYDEDDENIEDVNDLIYKSKKEANSNNFSKAYLLIKKATKYGIKSKSIKNAKNYITKQENIYNKKVESAYQIKQQNNLYVSNNAIKFISKDFKNICLGASRKYKDLCYNIQNRDLKNMCLGMTQDRNLCYNINDSELKITCLGITTDSNLCYNINDNDLKNICLGISKNYDSCYNIQDNNLKNMCIGISRNSSNCYNIK
jgi:hypothetical protein